ncbi:hypothetical protein VSH64_02265 [Amycolatopsis rhabdoformis]|uniref:Uncharacterized protein n=1 Tax=Amycolatopsis rhabdoformis TaxID=1448059 RepID=A0ABZ1IB42_9PSEU|nr:hypothetical protein [Amycolatopsis rhabdoformis]WSE30956.1 hypothetical protein VSH64_02265 [Amycolatopsis rhabdoformis]
MRRLIVVVAVLGLVSAGCSRSVAPDQGPMVAPAGYSLPKGAEHVVSPGMDPDLTVELPVGGLVKLDDDTAQRAQDARIWSVLRLAEVEGETSIYQAVAPGKAGLVIAAHGYPCPPRAPHCGTDTKGPLKLLVVVTPA